MEKIQKQVRRAQWWMGIQRFVGALGWCWLLTLTIALGLIVAGKYYPIAVADWVWGVGALGLGVVVAIVWSIARSRDPVDAAMEIDRRFGLKERVSSTLALNDQELQSEVGQALVDDASRSVDRVDVGQQFRVSPGRPLLLPLIPAVIALVVALFVNPVVVESNTNPLSSKAQKKVIKKTTETLKKELAKRKEEAKKQGLKDAEKLFRKLQEDTEGMTRSEESRKNSLVKMNDLSQELAERRKALGGARKVQEQLKQLKDLGKGPAEKMLDQMMKGNIKKALGELQQMQNDLAAGKMTPEEQKQLANQLNNMKKKIEEMAKKQQQAQEDLKKQIEQAKQAGNQNQANQLQQKLNQMKQQAPQMKQLQQMAQKMGQCAKCLKQGQGQNAANQLGQLQQDMQNLQQQLKEMEMVDGMMDQINQARNQMNCKKCGGGGCKMCQGQGQGQGKGQGKGQGQGLGAGRGRGDRPEEKTTVGFFDTKSANKMNPGNISYAGETDGPNIKGEVLQKIQLEYESAKGSTAAPLTNQRIPRKHRDHTEEYLNRFREGK